jgi:hypothetical protein
MHISIYSSCNKPSSTWQWDDCVVRKTMYTKLCDYVSADLSNSISNEQQYSHRRNHSSKVTACASLRSACIIILISTQPSLWTKITDVDIYNTKDVILDVCVAFIPLNSRVQLYLRLCDMAVCISTANLHVSMFISYDTSRRIAEIRMILWQHLESILHVIVCLLFITSSEATRIE